MKRLSVLLSVSLVAMLVVGLFLAVLAQLPVNEPPVAPHSIIAFPQRSFVSASGYAATDVVRVSVIHPSGATISTLDVIPQDDPATPQFDGIVEVNHPGAACWNGSTPDMRAGDKVRITVNGVIADQTTVANVRTDRPTLRDAGGNLLPAGTVQVRGTAQAPDGSPIPLAQIEQRLIIPGDAFDLNGRRSIRASGGGGNGVLAYDAPGSINWTATYSGLSAADVTRALNAEAAVLWLGANPAAGVEGTTFENGAGFVKGPAAPCTAPLEKLPPPPGSETTPPTTPTGVSAIVSAGSTVQISWLASTDNVGVVSYGIYRNGNWIGNVDASTLAYYDMNVPAGTYSYTVDAEDAATNRSAQSAPAGATTTAQLAPVGPVNEPPVAPRSIIAFPERDFISADGYLATDVVTVYVIRNGFTVSTSSGLVPADDPGTPQFDGIVEVNHPGGGCWEGVTPDLRPGDKVRIVTRAGVADQITVANVTAQRPTTRRADGSPLPLGTVQIRGTAMDANGNPLPLDQIEQRLVSGKDLFALSGKRTLRAPGAGVIAYDAAFSVNWTATYSGLTDADVARALRAESRAMWLGRDPLAGRELTIFEVGDAIAAGPSAPCTAPLEPLDKTAPTIPALSAARSGQKDVQLTWTPSSDNVGVTGYAIYRDGVLLRNVGGSTISWLDANVPAGLRTYRVAAFDSSKNQSGQSSPVSITMPDTTAPSTPLNVVTLVTLDSVAVSWSASIDDVAVTGYRVFRDGAQVGSTTGTVRTFTDVTVAVGAHTYNVAAFDAAGNVSPLSAGIGATILSPVDTTPPSVPSALQVTVSAKTVSLAWSAATDNVAVTGYGVYRRLKGDPAFTKIADAPAASNFVDPNLPAGTYEYAVDAVDSAANRSARSASATAIVANRPPVSPHSIIPFPQRDFVSASGYTAAEGPVVFTVLRNGVVVSQSTPVLPNVDGLYEVNHVGGGCWVGVTPDIRPGDVVRVTTAAGIPDETVVANVVSGMPVQVAPDTVQIKGTARDANGAPLPIGQIEQRLVAGGAALFANGRRALRAGPALDGTLAYDAPGSVNWTATYTGLSAIDVQLALSSESRILWLGADPIAAVESTIYEISPTVAGGPAAPCTAPLESAPVAVAAPASLAFGSVAVTTPATSSTVQLATLTNTGGGPLLVSSAAISGMSDFRITANTCSGAALPPGTSCSVGVQFTPAALGARSATLVFVDNAANSPTQSIALAGNGVDPSPVAPVVTAPVATILSPATFTGTASVRVAWNVTGMAVAHEMQLSTTAGQTWVDVTPAPSGPTAVISLAAGSNYRLRVRAVGALNNPSAWATGPTFGVSAFDDSNKDVGGGWTAEALRGAYGGGVRFATASGRKATFKVATTTTQGGVAFVSTLGPDRGVAVVQVDNLPAITVDLYAPTLQPARVVYASGVLAPGTHNVSVTSTGSRNAASSGSRVDVDAFVAIR